MNTGQIFDLHSPNYEDHNMSLLLLQGIYFVATHASNIAKFIDR